MEPRAHTGHCPTLPFQTGKLRPSEEERAILKLHSKSPPQSQALCLLRQLCGSGSETRGKASPPLAGGTLLSALSSRDSETLGKTGPSLDVTRKRGMVQRSLKVALEVSLLSYSPRGPQVSTS